MRGQIQIIEPAADAVARIAEGRDELRMLGNDHLPRELARLGGRVVSVDARELIYEEHGEPRERMLSIDVVIDVVDSMGANTVNTVCEAISARAGELAGGTVGMRILSNLCIERLATSMIRVPADDIGGLKVARGIAAAYRFARADPFRAATHNKGVMNGVSAVVLATGNDTRAVEAACHAYAGTKGHPDLRPERPGLFGSSIGGGSYGRRGSIGGADGVYDAYSVRGGGGPGGGTGGGPAASTPDAQSSADTAKTNTSYLPLTEWHVEEASGDLLGSISLPLPLGIVGGTIRAHPGAQANLRMMGVTTGNQLAEVIASVGLAQNMAALKALSGAGIQAGHMSLHARSVAAAAGIDNPDLAERVVAEMTARKSISIESAREIAELEQQKK
jgi:hydroxymethylglutaryl-CoA reductase